MAKFTGNKFKYTESELKDRHIGKTVYPNGPYEEKVKWRIKKDTYTNEGVWDCFTKLRLSFRCLFTQADGFIESDLATRCAQLMVDVFLVRRSNGENVFPPKDVVPVNAAPTDTPIEGALDAADFVGKKAVSANAEVRWIFDNLKIANVDPATAPSSGAYGYLMELQSKPEMSKDFLRTIYPKLLTKEDAEKGGKLADTGKETIELCERLLDAVERKE